MNRKVMCSVFGILVCLTVVAPAVIAQTTPFMIYGNILDRYDDPCNGSTVHITNLATDASWYAENSSTLNYYQWMLVEGTDFDVGETLRFRVIGPEGIQSNIVEHTVTAEDVANGGMFIDITLMYLDQQAWYLTDIDKPTELIAGDSLTHTVDNKMQKGVKCTEDGSFEVNSTAVAWFYADTGADIDLGFGEHPWEASIRTARITPQQSMSTLTVEICKLDKDTGAVTVLALYEEQLPETLGQYSWDITCEDNPATQQDFSTGDWLAVRLSWDCADSPLYVYYKETQPTGGIYYSYIASTYADPGYPIPELSTLILFGLGLLMIAGYVELRRRRE